MVFLGDEKGVVIGRGYGWFLGDERGVLVCKGWVLYFLGLEDREI